MILFLNNNNFYTISITNRPKEISAKEADKIYDLSYTNNSKVLKIFEKENAKQIFSTGSDAALLTQSYIQKHFELNGNSIEKVHFFTNKWNYKNELNKSTLSPKTVLYNGNNISFLFDNNNKAVAKPSRGSGSHGLIKLESENDIKSLNKKTTYLIEQFIEGNEIGCDVFIYNNKILYVCPTSKEINNYDVPISHLILSNLISEKLQSFIKEIKEVLALQDGFYNLDIMQRKDEFFLLDISPRLGGNCIPDIIYIGYGVNEYDFLTKWLFKKTIEKFNFQFSKNVGVYIIGSNQKGILIKKEENHPFKEFEIELFWNKRIGDHIEILNQGSQHLGYFIFTANSDEDLKSLLEQVKTYRWFALEKTESPTL